MTADCSQHKSFAVMTRSLKPVSLGKELLVSLEKSKIVMTPTSASASPLIKVWYQIRRYYLVEINYEHF